MGGLCSNTKSEKTVTKVVPDEQIEDKNEDKNDIYSIKVETVEIPKVEINYDNKDLKNEMEQQSKKILNDKQNKDSFISNANKNESFANKIEITTDHKSDTQSNTKDHTPDKDELLLESVDDENYHKKRIAKMDEELSEEDKDVNPKHNGYKNNKDFFNLKEAESIPKKEQHLEIKIGEIPYPNIFQNAVDFVPEFDKLKVYLLNNSYPDNYIPLEVEHPMPDCDVELMLMLNQLSNQDNIVDIKLSIRTNKDNKPEYILDVDDTEQFEDKSKNWYVSINGKRDTLTNYIENFIKINQNDFIVLQIN